MSGLSFSERVKMLLQKRLDTTKWPLGDSGQGPGAIRYLTDGQGNIIALLTTSINPNDAEPIGPGSAEKAAEKDPFINLADQFQLPFTKTPEVWRDDVVIHARVSGTNTDATFHEDAGDYSVPTGRKTRFYRMICSTSTAVVTIALGHGSDGVADGTAGPTDPVFFWGVDLDGMITIPVANIDEVREISITVPAGRFPWMSVNATNANKSCILFGVELDA